ncbi:hypothetical protein NKR23_g9610 [Pleurostoma richardsiae]|uniref:Uncharacterized protein n=1 Tax=Pleurostoma richardsiae TaxID=41990 RepID=A0AA38RF71_9PEZI|nr:hypothetical protein NKR23_g9610 [Pleurostoma richardsiae]
MDYPVRRTMLHHFAAQAATDHASGVPQPAQLPTLVKYNVFNALGRNAAALGIYCTKWLLCDSMSPFGSTGPLAASDILEALPGSTCPDSLRPTALQLTVPHRPWIDLFPLPRMRDNILLATMDTRQLNGRELCFDMVEAYGTTSAGPEDPLLLVWGEPWDPYGWEASVAFLRKWGWLLRGCREILESTNHWRELRGEMKLDFSGL